MPDIASSQADNIVAPRRGKIVALTVDSTARAYDISAVDFGAAYRGNGYSDYVWVDFAAETSDVYVAFSDASHTDLDDTAAIAAGSTLAFANTHGSIVFAGTVRPLRIQRNVDRFLIVKTASGSATLRMNASSQSNA